MTHTGLLSLRHQAMDSCNDYCSKDVEQYAAVKLAPLLTGYAAWSCHLDAVKHAFMSQEQASRHRNRGVYA